MIKRKFYLEKIVKLIDTEDIKVITGVRRCGKTVLLKQIIDELENRGIASENIIYMSFESSKYKNIRNDDDLDEFIFSKTNNLISSMFSCISSWYWINSLNENGSIFIEIYLPEIKVASSPDNNCELDPVI